MPRDKNGHFYYGWYPTIVKGDTAHLTLAEDGAYRRLIDEYMVARAPIKSDDRALARLIGIGLDEWLAVKGNVMTFFKPTPNRTGYVSHGFCDRELEQDHNRIETARSNGHKGGRHKTQHEPTGLPNPNPTLKGLPDLSTQLNSEQLRRKRLLLLQLKKFFREFLIRILIWKEF